MTLPLPAELYELVRRASRDSLACFTRLFWPVVNPGVPLIWGRHMDAICEHLEAVSRREIRSLVVEVPPGHTKSTICNQMWPAWEWLHFPARRWFFVSNRLENARKESGFRRQIIQSPLYQALSPSFKLQLSGRRVMWLRNDQNGSFRALSTGTTILSDHADTHVVDDPHDTLDLSHESLAAVREWDGAVLSTRVRDDSASVLIMQPLAEGDLADHRVKRGVDAHICLPALYSRDTDPGPTPLGWRDWRTRDGELLYPERFGDEWIERKRADLGRVAFSAQILMQRIAGEGNLFQRDWWLQHDALPGAIVAWQATVDLASATGETADLSVFQVWALGADGVAYLCEQVAGRWEQPEKLARAEALARRWPLCRQWRVEQRGEGFSFIDHLRLRLKGWAVIPWKSQEHKESRIRGCSPLVEARLVSLPTGAPGTPMLIEEAAKFPRGAHDDQIDAMAIALSQWLPRMMRGPTQPRAAIPQASPSTRPPPPVRTARLGVTPGRRMGSF
jgi:predicted phage terminase large subunit-like protein